MTVFVFVGVIHIDCYMTKGAALQMNFVVYKEGYWALFYVIVGQQRDLHMPRLLSK
jgi:hypothetical protein